MRRLAWRSLVAATWFASGLGAVAQPAEFDSPPRASAPRPLNIDAPVEQRLPNGLRVVLAQRRGVQLVSAELLVLAGAEVDPSERGGLASMTAGMLTKGTRRHTATQLAQAAESLGGSLDSGAGWHQSSVSITVMPQNLDAALGLVSEVVRQPTFAAPELERLRAQTLDGLRVAYGQPGTLAQLASQRLLFGAGPYGHPAGGTPASLPRVARSDLVALHAARYRPDNAVLVLAGDLDFPTAMQLARRHFGTWRPTASAAPVGPSTANAEIALTTALVDMPQSGQAAVIVAAPLPAGTADRATAAVLNSVLGGGFSSRLNQEIRIRRGLSYGARSAYELRPGGGAMRAIVQTKNESAPEVVALVQQALDELVGTPVPEPELAARKATLIGNFSRSVETTAGLAGAVSSLVVAGLDPSELRGRIAAIEAVTPADVQRYAVANLGTKVRRVVVAGEAARFAEALKTFAPGLVVLPAEKIDAETAALPGR
jgi:zinc protease